MSQKIKFPISDHCDGKRFFNPSGMAPKGLKAVLKWRFSSERKPWPKWVENKVRSEPVETTHDNEIVLTFINHVTFLIQMGGMNILTDPVFSKRVSPFQHIGPKRVHAPGLAFDHLPKIDLVLVSHNHYDHMDIPTIKKLARKFQPQFVTPLGNGHFLKRAGAHHVIETDWWQDLKLNSTEIITVPAEHWSARGLHDRNHALWSGFVVQTKRKKIFFAGDTGYGAHFKQIYERLGIMDIALLPIGAYEPRWFMRSQHMNPEDAVHAHRDLNAKLSIGMHFGTFQLTDEAHDEPLKDLQIAMNRNNVTNFKVLAVGETFKI